MKKLLTVVVPAYNAERDLVNNLESLCLSGSENRIEILVIDDGSADQTGTIADSYEQTYPGIVRVIHKENGGHGSGINTGIAHASGRYFKVVDADDWVEPEAFRHLISFLDTTDADVVGTGFLWAFEEKNRTEAEYKRKAEFLEPFQGVEYRKVYEFDAIAKDLYLKMHGLTIKTELLRENRIVLDEHCFYVDTEYILYPIPYVKTIAFLPDFVYQYRIGRSGQSVSPEKMRKLRNDFERVLHALLLFYEGCVNGKDGCSEAKRKYIAGVIARVAAGKMKILLSEPIARERKQELKRFDELLKTGYTEIYQANQNRAVWMLRKSRFFLYPAAAMMLKLKQKAEQ